MHFEVLAGVRRGRRSPAGACRGGEEAVVRQGGAGRRGTRRWARLPASERGGGVGSAVTVRGGGGRRGVRCGAGRREEGAVRRKTASGCGQGATRSGGGEGRPRASAGRGGGGRWWDTWRALVCRGERDGRVRPDRTRPTVRGADFFRVWEEEIRDFRGEAMFIGRGI